MSLVLDFAWTVSWWIKTKHHWEHGLHELAWADLIHPSTVVLITLVTFTHKWENRLFLLSYICWWAKSIIRTCWTWCIHTNCILSSFLLTDLLHLIDANLKPPILLVFFYRKYILHPTFYSEHSIWILILNHRICQQISKYP